MISGTLLNHPRILNVLHAMGMAAPATQTIGVELEGLARYAKGRRVALEIGTFHGVSARAIAAALAADGRLYCVDPWDPIDGRENVTFTIAKRHFARGRVAGRIVPLQGTSVTMERQIPMNLDFVFIDGDHSYQGLATDWAIVAPRVAPGGMVCLHDTTIPAAEPHRQHGSVDYFEEAIRADARFRHVETIHCMHVMQRLA